MTTTMMMMMMRMMIRVPRVSCVLQMSTTLTMVLAYILILMVVGA